jgi:hypothetical protein
LWAYLYWRGAHFDPLPEGDRRTHLYIAETVAEWISPVTGEPVNAFFAADAPPLLGEELDHAACLFEWTTADLLNAFTDLPEQILERKVEQEWSINGILYHTARGDWCYLRALGIAPDWSLAPEQVGLPALLGWTTQLILKALPGLANDPRVDLVSGEL